MDLNSGLDYGISHCVLGLIQSVRPQKSFFTAGKATNYVYKMPWFKHNYMNIHVSFDPLNFEEDCVEVRNYLGT